MNRASDNPIEVFNNQVGIKFQLYNSLFTSLSFHKVEKAGVLLTMFLILCVEGYEKKQSPEEIISSSFEQNTSCGTAKDQNDLLLRFIQYAEMQVEPFDALEDAAFTQVHDPAGPGTPKHLNSEVDVKQASVKPAENFKDFSVKPVYNG